MDYTALLKTIERDQLPPVLLIHGPDVQLLDDALAAITRAVFPDPALATLGREMFDAREAAVDAIVRAASTLPFMTGTRLVVVRRVQLLAAKAADDLGAYVRDPNPSTRLVLLADESLEASRDRKEHWLLRAVPSAGIVSLPMRRGRGLEEWLKQRAAAEGLTVSDEAARLLVQWVGDDTAALLGEVRKAALSAGPANRAVGVKDVTAIVGEHRLSGVFDLTRAIERRDVSLALRVLDRLLSSEEPMLLLTMLAREVRTAWTVREAHARGQSTDQIARLVRRPPSVVDPLIASASRSPADSFPRKLRRCWDVERRLKSGGIARAEMTTLVAELCRDR